MTNLETELRAMLQERAGDITTVPDRIVPDPHDELLERRRPGRQPRTTWLVAASVAAVIAVATVMVASSGDQHATPPSDHTASTTAPTPPPTTPTTHATRTVKLTWFGMQNVAGFDELRWSSDRGYRTLALRSRADTELPAGCNGCEIASDYVYVFDRDAFDAAKYRVPTWNRTTVAGDSGYLGTMARYGIAERHVVPTLAWQFRPREWVVVQGVTSLGARATTLQKLAAAVRPTASVPIELPFRLDYVPDSSITQITDDRAAGYAFVMHFRTADGLSFDITLWNKVSYAGLFDTSRASYRNIGGLPGWSDPEPGAAVRYHDGIAVLEFSGDTGGPVRQAGQRAVLLQRSFDQVLRGLHWVNGDGRAPYVAAEDAIP